MLQKHLPFALVHPENPLFKVEIRHARIARSSPQLKNSTLFWGGMTMGILLILWAVSVYWTVRQSGRSNPAYYYSYDGFAASNQFLSWLFVLSLGANLLLDMRCMISGLGSVSGEITSGRWDLLRLTLLPEEYMVGAKYALAQIRSWRWMTVILSARLTLVILLLLHAFLLPLLIYGQSSYLGLLSPMAMYFIIGLGMLIGIFVIEPYWRMCALTALSLAISARVHSVVSAFLTAFAAIVILWIVQILIIGAFAWFTLSISIIALICSPLIFAIFGFVVWVFYTRLRDRSLRHAAACLTNLN